MCHKECLILDRWHRYVRVVPSVYRLLAFAMACGKIFFFSSVYHSVVPILALVTGVGIYSVVKALHPIRWQRAGVLGPSLLGADIAICSFLLVVTGGIYSPFLLYTLTPILTAALLLDGKVTFTTAGLSVIYVALSHLVNPFFATKFYFPDFSVYLMSAFLIAILPYLINVNLRQRLLVEDMLRERQRLSHEIHDGAAQAVSALRWQAQLVHRHLVAMDINLVEVEELVRIAEKAHQDARESLELLRSYTGDGSFLLHFKDYLKHLSQSTDINFRLVTEASELNLEAPVELELLRICQEALTNVRKHSGAHQTLVKVGLVNSHVAVNITDDGRGFDALAYYHDGVEAEGHGLAIMRERAESVGGRLRVLSKPGDGTEVQVEVPLNSHRGRLL